MLLAMSRMQPITDYTLFIGLYLLYAIPTLAVAVVFMLNPDRASCASVRKPDKEGSDDVLIFRINETRRYTCPAILNLVDELVLLAGDGVIRGCVQRLYPTVILFPRMSVSASNTYCLFNPQ